MYVSCTLPGAAVWTPRACRSDRWIRVQLRLFGFPAQPAGYPRPDSPTHGNRKVITGWGNRIPRQSGSRWGAVDVYRGMWGMFSAWSSWAPNRLYAGWGKKEPVDEIRHEDAQPCRFPLD